MSKHHHSRRTAHDPHQTQPLPACPRTFFSYKLTPSEIAQVLGTAAEDHISEVADRNAGVVLKISKGRLAPLSK